jgi:hypothetical protein
MHGGYAAREQPLQLELGYQGLETLSKPAVDDVRTASGVIQGDRFLIQYLTTTINLVTVPPRRSFHPTQNRFGDHM